MVLGLLPQVFLTTLTPISGIANNNFKAAEYMVHISNGGNMQAQKVLVMQDGNDCKFYRICGYL